MLTIRRNHLLKVLRKTLNNLDVGADFKGKITQDLNEKWQGAEYACIDELMPKYLYKYRKADEKRITNFKNDAMYLGYPSEFNDPSDCLLYLDLETITGMVFDPDNEVPDLYKRNGLESPVIKREDGKILDGDYFSRAWLLDKAINFPYYITNKMKVISLSEVNNSPLMWAHYADDHKGFAIRYKTKNMFMNECEYCDQESCYRRGCPLFPVLYSEKRFDPIRYINLYLVNEARPDLFEHKFKMPFNKILPPLTTLTQKSKDWSYEKEWRIICNDTNKDKFKLKPDAVILGSRIKSENAKAIVQIALDKHLKVYQEGIDYYSKRYVVSVEELDREYCKDILKYGLDE